MKKHYLTLQKSNFRKINGFLLAFIFTLIGQQFFAQTIHFQDNFSTGIASWSNVDDDGDTRSWEALDMTGAGSSFDAQAGVAISRSWDNVNGGYSPDNYLISPAIDLSSAGSSVTVSFKLGSREAAPYHAEYVSVYIVQVTTISNITSTVPIHSQLLTSPDMITNFTYDISGFQGFSDVHVVVRHHNTFDMNFLVLDDVKVESNGSGSTNDLAILKRYSHNIETGLDYSIIPNSQVQPLEVGVELTNLGSITANNIALGILINDGTSDVYYGTQIFSVGVGETKYVWRTINYTPQANKNYTITFNLPNDDNATNNVGTNTFKTMGSTYAHDYTSTTSMGFDINDEVSIGNRFDIYSDVILYSLDVEFETGTTAGMPVTINIYDINDLSTPLASGTHTVTAGNIGNGITTNIPFSSIVNLFAGNQYFVEVRKPNNTNRLYIGASTFGNDDNSTIIYGPFGAANAVGFWINPTFKAPFVRMNFAAGCTDFVSSISSSNSSSCVANSGSIMCQSSGSTATANGYTYSWTGTASGTSGPGQTANYTIANLAPGTYTVTVTNGSCSFTSIQVQIALDNAPTITTSVLQPISCFGLSDGVVGYEATGETGGYTFTWNTGSTQQNLTNLPAGAYTLTASNGVCNLTSTVNLTQPGDLQLTTAPSPTTSCGGNNGQILVNVAGGTPSSFTYSWSGTASGSSASNLGNSFNITNLSAGTYSITVTSGVCSTNISADVTEPEIAITNSVTNVTTCGGTNGQILVSASNGPTSSYLYTWTGNVTGSSGSGFGNSFNITNLSAGNYIVNVTNGACSNSVTVVVGENGAPVINIIELTDIECAGESTGSIKVTSTSNISTYTFTWSNSSNGIQLNNIPAGTYTVNGTNGTCSVTKTYTLFEPTPIVISGSVFISTILISNVSGGTGSYSYSWTGPNGFTSTSANIYELPVVGAYTLTVTDQNSCSVSETYNLTQVGINDLSNTSNFKVYPNPSNDVVNFELTSDVKSIVITDLAGKIINSLAVENDKTVVNVSNFSTGLYLYTLVNEKGNVIYTNKFSVSK